MLEVKHLKKTYKTKGGVEIHALDDVSIRFPETGMVFLLGKSGSGKSTLLNVSGGLDKPDDGEVIVKGKSSKNFTQADFDSYRNTYVGFVFQEYNILSEFNVETNIALALELQGKKNDKEEVNKILHEVDLDGLGKRKPNTLSGGQKQRIAIARALIKSPEIIMADEPTGALDSETGKQVLETLKKLSKTKLVIVVSHDQEFAEHYGDRIIELKDGKVISDISKEYKDFDKLSENIHSLGEGNYEIKDSSKLTKEEFEDLFNKIKQTNSEVIISTGEENVATFKKNARINENGHQEHFVSTKEDKIDIVEYDGSKTKFINSKLPMKHALKMGASNLKIKPLRLVFTMTLCIVAFTLFGILSTLMTYNPAYSYADALRKSDLQSLIIQKEYNASISEVRTDTDGNTEILAPYEDSIRTQISKQDIEQLDNNNLGLEFAGIYDFDVRYEKNLGIDHSNDYYSLNYLYGLTDCGENYLLNQGFTRLVGHYPQNDNEIAISRYVFDTFKEFSYKNENGAISQILEPNDLIGKSLRIDLSAPYYGDSLSLDLTISGIYETNEYLMDEKYDILKVDDKSYVSNRELLNLGTNFLMLYESSYYGLGYVSSEFYNKYAYFLMSPYTRSEYINSTTFFGNYYLNPSEYREYLNAPADERSYYFPHSEWDTFEGLVKSNLEEYEDNLYFVDLNGNAIDGIPSLNDNEAFSNAYSDGLFNEIVFCLIENAPDDSFYEQKPYIKGNSVVVESLIRYLYYAGYNSYYISILGDLSDANLNKPFDSEDVKNIIDAYKVYYDLYKDTKMDLIDLNSVKGGISSYKDNKMHELTVKGFFFTSNKYYIYSPVYLSDTYLSLITKPYDYYDSYYSWGEIVTTKYVVDESAQYGYAICNTNKTNADLNYLLKEYEDDSQYYVTNSLFDSIRFLVSLIQMLETIFLTSGIVVAVFSGLMLLNFISTSISYREKEIGILRAVGARGVDVFKIYFSESAIIGAICLVVSTIFSVIGSISLNAELSYGLNIVLFNFGPLNMLFILGVSLLVCFAGTIIPVIKASKRPPVESIRAL